MNAKELALVVGGMLIMLIIVGAYLGVNYLTSQTPESKLSSQLQLNSPISANKFFGILNGIANNNTFNISYVGTIVVKSVSGVTTSVDSFNTTAIFAKYHNATLLQFIYSVPSSSYSSTNYTVTLIKNSTDSYFCSYQIAQYSLYGSVQKPCVNSTTLAILDNTTYNPTVSMFDLLSLNGARMTVTSISPGTYQGAQCIRLNGTISGTVPFSQLQSVLSSIYIFVSSAQAYYPSNNAAAGISGIYSICVSRASLMPDSINAAIKINGLTEPISLQISMNKSSENVPTSNADVQTLPGEMAQLSDILRGYCYTPSPYSAYSQLGTAFTGDCQNIMNTSGTLKLNYSTQSSYYAGYYGPQSPEIELLGLACISTPPPTTYSYLFNSTTAHLQTYKNQQPNVSQFRAVNISLTSSSNNVTLYFNCPLNSTKLGTKFNGEVWAYYKSGDTTNVAPMFALYAYVTSFSKLGNNTNTGHVSPLPTSLPISDALTVTGYDPSDASGRYLEIFVDTYPGAYLGYGRYANASSYYTNIPTETNYTYLLNLNGSHTIYVLITQSGGSSYGTYSGSISINGANTVNYNGVDAHHAVKLTILNSKIVNSSTVSLP
jgi:hypothetical protein